MSLTDLQIKRMTVPLAGQKIHFDGTLRGFGIRVSKGGAKTFVLVHGKKRAIHSLGRYPDLSLAHARKKAVETLAALIRENDAPTMKAASMTFFSAREQFLGDAEKRNKPSTFIEYKRLLTRHFTFDKQLTAVTRHDIMEAVIAERGKPSVEQHCFVAIRTMMNWCVRQGLLESSPVPQLRFSTKSRKRILTNTELKLVWQRAEEVGYPYGTVVKLLILTGQRRGEIAGLKRSWVSSNAITYPEGFTKNKREHVIPIGALTQSILHLIVVNTDLYFSARGDSDKSINGWSKAKRQFDASLKIAPYTLHDVRRTFSSNCAKLGVPLHVTEKMINHVTGTISGPAAVYNLYEFRPEMTDAMTKHEQFVSALVGLANET